MYHLTENVIKDPKIAVFKTSLLVPLIMSQFSKLSVYTDMLYMTIVFTCGNYILAVLSVISMGIYISGIWIQTLLVVKDYIFVNSTHSAAYINLTAKFSYNSEVKSIAELLERCSTACTIKFKSFYIPTIIVINLMKFILQNLPHTCLELYSIIFADLSSNEASFLFAFVFSVISLLLSFYSAIKVQPSLCNADMLKQLSYKKYREKLIEDNSKSLMKFPTLKTNKSIKEKGSSSQKSETNHIVIKQEYTELESFSLLAEEEYITRNNP